MEHSESDFYDYLSRLTKNNRAAAPGDDCAVLNITEPPLLVTVDSLSFQVHYDSSYRVDEIGQKLVKVNVSDIIAMGGVPCYGLVSYSGFRPVEKVQQLSAAINRHAREFGVEIIGGDTSNTNNPDEETVGLTLLGRAHPQGILRRGGAEAGELLAVSGPLGAAAAVLRSKRSTENRLRKHLYDFPLQPLLGKKLVDAGCRCATDISDGLICDLENICRASRLGAVLNPTKIPVHSTARKLSRTPEAALAVAVGGGEDYQLLVSLPQTHAALADELDLTVIGRLTKKLGINFQPQLPFEKTPGWKGYDHFKNHDL